MGDRDDDIYVQQDSTNADKATLAEHEIELTPTPFTGNFKENCAELTQRFGISPETTPADKITINNLTTGESREIFPEKGSFISFQFLYWLTGDTSESLIFTRTERNITASFYAEHWDNSEGHETIQFLQQEGDITIEVD